MAAVMSDLRESSGKRLSNHARMESSKGCNRACRAARRSSGERPADLALNRVELSNALDGLLRHRRAVCLVQIVELAANVRPADDFLDATAFVQLIETGVGIRLQTAGKIPQMLSRMIAFAIRRVRKPNRWWIRGPTGPVVANISPQAPGLSLSCPRRQHGYWRVVGVQLVAVENVTPQYFHQRRHQFARRSYPPGEGRAFQIHSLPSVDLRLPIQRQVIGVLRDQHMRQQARSCHAMRDRPRLRRRLYDSFTGGAAQLRTHLADYFEMLGHVLEHLRHIFADLTQPPAATRAHRFLRLTPVHFARKMLGQWTATWLASKRRCHLCRHRARAFGCLVCLQLLQSQLQLIDLPLHFFRASAKLLAL